MTLTEIALRKLTTRLKNTWTIPNDSPGHVRLDFGYFANVIQITPQQGIAFTTDGVGTKALIAQRLGKYDTIGIDCVAMNVNDLLCVGATPLAMLDYLAVQTVQSDILDAIGKGLAAGASQAGISIPGGELAQIKDMLKAADERPLQGFDLVGSAVGLVSLNNVIIGQDIKPGDAIIGIESNGIHCNGLTLARQILSQDETLYDKRYPEFECRSLGEELLRPTHIYAKEVLTLLEEDTYPVPSIKAIVHITGDGLANLRRTAAATNLCWCVTALPPLPPIFSLLQKLGNVGELTMFETYNMGIGLCLVVSPSHVRTTLETIARFGKQAWQIGHISAEAEDGRIGVITLAPNKQLWLWRDCAISTELVGTEPYGDKEL